MIQIQELTVQYGEEKAIDNVSLAIGRDQTVAIVGPSGCGKTSLLNVLAGLIRPDFGQLLIGNQSLPETSVNTGLVMQDSALFPWMSVSDNIKIGLRAKKLKPSVIQNSVRDILKQMDLTIHSDKYPSQLSGGQKQRVSLARTLVTNPDVLLLDEPTSALDAMTKEALQNLILNLHKNRPRTTVLVTHSIEEAVYIGQTILVMESGRFVHTIDNPNFGLKNVRDQVEFYDTVLKVRKALNEV